MVKTVTRTERKSPAPAALTDIFLFSVEKLLDIAGDGSQPIEDTKGYRYLLQITHRIGRLMVNKGIAPTLSLLPSLTGSSRVKDLLAEDAPTPPHGTQLPPSNGNGHNGHTNGHQAAGLDAAAAFAVAPVTTPATTAVEPKPDEFKWKDTQEQLTPKEDKLYGFLQRRYPEFTPVLSIAKHLGQSSERHVSPFVAKLREKGVKVEAASTLRRDGEAIPEGVSGYRLAASMRTKA